MRNTYKNMELRRFLAVLHFWASPVTRGGWGGVDATAKKLWVRSETRPLVPFFRRCADKECTGFVLNVLVVEPAEDEDEVVVDENAPEAVKLLLRKKAEESIDEQYAVGWHRDATLGLKPEIGRASCRERV